MKPAARPFFTAILGAALLGAILGAASLLFGACAHAQPAPPAGKYEFKRTSTNGLAWTNPTAAAVPDSVLTLDAAAAPVFLPSGSFATAAQLAAKLDRIDAPNNYIRAYTINKDGTNAPMLIAQSVSGNSLVQRTGGNIQVPDTPTLENAAASKMYVDTKQDKLTAGENITITGGTISATSGTAAAGFPVIGTGGVSISNLSNGTLYMTSTGANIEMSQGIGVFGDGQILIKTFSGKEGTLVLNQAGTYLTSGSTAFTIYDGFASLAIAGASPRKAPLMLADAPGADYAVTKRQLDAATTGTLSFIAGETGESVPALWIAGAMTDYGINSQVDYIKHSANVINFDNQGGSFNITDSAGLYVNGTAITPAAGGLPITGDGVSITNPVPDSIILKGDGGDSYLSIDSIEGAQLHNVYKESAVAVNSEGVYISSAYGGIRMESPDGGIEIRTINSPITLHSVNAINLESEDIGTIRATLGDNGVRFTSLRYNRELFYFDNTGFYGWSATQNAWVLIFGTGLQP